MRNYSKTIGALAAASTLVAGTAMAELEGEVSVGYANMYEFRFVDQGNDLISAGVDLAYDCGGPWSLSGGAWYGTWDTPGIWGSSLGQNSDELDLYGAINWAVTDSFALELGYIYYMFPDTAGALDTSEIYVGATYDFSFGLSLFSTAYWDIDQHNGVYVDTGIKYTWEFNECLDLQLAAGFGYANGHTLQQSSKLAYQIPGYRGATADGYQGYYLSAALPWEFRDGVTLTPYVKYTDGEGGLKTDQWITGGQDYVIAGLSLAVGF